MNIILCGFMGTGKTSIGRELSRRLGWAFVDTDDEIVARAGKPIARIFRDSGEEYFRALEEDVIRKVCSGTNRIIATGGGALTRDANVRALRRGGLLVRLECEPLIILKRTMAEGGLRPLLNVEEPLKEIRKLLRTRTKAYAKADFGFDTSYLSVGEAAHEIMEACGLEESGVRVDLGERSYDIRIGSGSLAALGRQITPLRPTRVALVTNTTVDALYGSSAMCSLSAAGLEPVKVVLPDGEGFKDLFWAYKVLGDLLAAGFDRSSLVVALGGGVVGDLAAFVASVYMRGIRCVQVPTTLLSQVDSSVGGKTGVNHPLGKNMIGTFHQPSLVVIDTATLGTLPEEEYRAGLAEVIKYGVIWDRQLFGFLEKNRKRVLRREEDVLAHIVRRSCQIKAEVVSRDEREGGLRAILNYGHTVGHAVETATAYSEYLHGSAVGLGMVAAASMAVAMKVMKGKDAERVRRLVGDYGLPDRIPRSLSPAALVRLMGIDKKNVGGSITMILPRGIGTVERVPDIPPARLEQVIRKLQGP